MESKLGLDWNWGFKAEHSRGLGDDFPEGISQWRLQTGLQLLHGGIWSWGGWGAGSRACRKINYPHG